MEVGGVWSVNWVWCWNCDVDVKFVGFGLGYNEMKCLYLY